MNFSALKANLNAAFTEASTLNWRSYLFLLAISLITILLLSLGYTYAGSIFSSPWLGVALLNTFLALIIFYYFLVYKKQPSIVRFKELPLESLLPAVLVILVSLVLAFLNSSHPLVLPEVPAKQIAFVLWIPVIEEIVFRLGLTSGLQVLSNRFWAGFFSAIVFAAVHNYSVILENPTLLLALPLGPLLLGLVCEVIYALYKNIWPCIALHMACNATVIIFMLDGGYWIKHLDFLYITT